MAAGHAAEILHVDEVSSGDVHKEVVGLEEVSPQEGALHISHNEFCVRLRF